MRLIDLPIISLSILGIMLFVIIALNIAILIYSFKIKKYFLFIPSVILFIIDSFLFLIINVYIYDNSSVFASFFINLPLIAYIIYLLINISFIVFARIFLIRWHKNNISPSSFIDLLNQTTEGILYFNEDGICLLINDQMASIAKGILSHPISNAHEFYRLVNNKIVHQKDNHIYKFISNTLTITQKDYLFRQKKEDIYELIAFDITDLSNANEELKKDNEQIRKHNLALNEYHKNMQNIIANKEILSAKVHIHDEMNNLLLQTSFLFNKEDEKEKKEVLKKWRNNVLLLCKEASYENDMNVMDDLLTLAKGVGVNIKCDNYRLLDNDDIIKLFIHACKESILNVYKHSESKELIIDIIKEENKYLLRFINDNQKNKHKKIIIGGGLSALKEDVKSLNGEMEIENKGQFILTVEVPYVI